MVGELAVVPPRRPLSDAMLVAGTYAAVAMAYIVASDRVLWFLAADPATRELLSTGKGLGFVLVTAAGLFVTMLLLERRAGRERRGRIATLRRLGDLSDAMPNPLLVLSPDGRLQEWNRAFEAVSGYPAARLRQMTVTELAHPDDLDAARISIARVIAEGSSDGTDVRLITADGKLLFYRWRGGAIHDDDGQVTGVAVFGLDLTDLHLAQDQLMRSLQASRRLLRQTVDTLMLAVEKRDPLTIGYESKVVSLSRAIGERLGMTEAELEGLEYAGLLHDIGKLAVPAEIFVKPGRLSPSEHALLQTHVEHGCDILATIDFPWPVVEIVRQHHERLDGSGYPQGLRGESIRREARVLAVADVLVAMCSHRPYRSAVGLDGALAELWAGAGTRYDLAVVAACDRLFASGYALPDVAA